MVVKNILMGFLLLGSTQAVVAQQSLCSNYVVVELKLHDNGVVPNVPGGAFVHDSVYIGVGIDEFTATANANNACQAGKYSAQDCQLARKHIALGMSSQYGDVIKNLIDCKD